MEWRRLWRRRARESLTVWRTRRSRLILRLAVGLFVAVLGGLVLLATTFAVVASDLPSPDKVVRREGFSTRIRDRNGKLLYEVFTKEKRTPVEISAVPKYLRDATVAIEDKNFYKHEGFDVTGWVRAIYNTIFSRKRLAGGSTLTQQLVKNVLLSSQRTVWRKMREFILAVQIEKKFSKDEILQMYLNEAPFGGTVWGVEAASETYFGKKVSDLNLVESAVLAGLPQRPSYYSPFSNNGDAYKGRARDVLRRMREDGYIDKQLEEQAVAELDALKFSTDSGEIRAPHFVFYVKKLLEERYGEAVVEQGGLNVVTSLDLDLQEIAQKTVAEEIAKVEKLKITNGAAVAMDPMTGEILAMVGSKNYSDPGYDGKVNVALSMRQPGSAIKPVTYVTAFKKGYTPSTVLMDVATSFPGGADRPEYKPLNYDGKFRGPMQLRFALANSLNIPSVKLLALVGVKDVLETAYGMGISSLEPTDRNLSRLGLSMTLGGGEVSLLDMVSAYSAFSNGGMRVDPVAILKVTDREGKVLEEYRHVEGKRILDLRHVFLINHILSDNKARESVFGSRSLLSIPNRTVAVKTGTTNERRDNWTIGWGSKSRIVGVWVGNNDNSSMREVSSGVTGAAPIWRKILLSSLEKFKDSPFDVPSGMVTVDVDSVSGYRAHDGFASRSEYFVGGTEPVNDDPMHKKLKVCKASGKLATPIDIARGDFEEKEYLILKESDPTGGKDGVNLWQKGIDEWVASQSGQIYHPPTEYCESRDEISVEIRSPGDRTTVDTNDVKLKGEAFGASGIKVIELFIDGSKRESFNSSPFELTVYLSDGVHTAKATYEDNSGRKTEREIRFGVKTAWDYSPSPSPVPATASPTLPPEEE